MKSAYSGSGNERGVRALSAGRGPDVADEILSLEEVDPLLRAELQTERLLLRTGVDGDDAETLVDRVLDGEVAEASAGAGDDDEVAGLRLAVLDRAVGSDARAEDGRGLVAVVSLRDRSYVVHEGDLA